jgi:cystathionine beta-lyase
MEAVRAMLDGMKLFAMGASWGGYESLIIPFDPRAPSAPPPAGPTPAAASACTAASKTPTT